MTSTKIVEMKKNFTSEFTLIYQLCESILDKSQDPGLLSSTLKCLLRFLHWIPIGYIFETKLLGTLALKVFLSPCCLRCRFAFAVLFR
jgi:exportin-1